MDLVGCFIARRDSSGGIHVDHRAPRIPPPRFIQHLCWSCGQPSSDHLCEEQRGFGPQQCSFPSSGICLCRMDSLLGDICQVRRMGSVHSKLYSRGCIRVPLCRSHHFWNQGRWGRKQVNEYWCLLISLNCGTIAPLIVYIIPVDCRF